MRLIFLYVVIFGCVLGACNENGENKSQTSTEGSENSKAKLPERVLSRFEFLLNHQVDSLAFPRSLKQNGETRVVKSSDWTSGFFPGNLILIGGLLGDDLYLNKAAEWLVYLEKEKYNDRTHDMGFKINCSYGQALVYRKSNSYEQILIESARTLSSRYNEKVGCIKSWDFGKDKWVFPVIIDNMMNLELLFRSTILSKDSSYYHIAMSHATKTMQNHFRPDNSSYHVIDYDPDNGQVLQRLTHQGYNAESSWARGQAWGLYGFTMAYRYSKNKQFLDQAVKIANYIISHPNLPSDKIPYWDFDDPNIPNTPRDVSAASVIASALIELSDYVDNDLYLTFGSEMITSMVDGYLLDEQSVEPFILNHATGNMPKSDEINVPIVYGDYYFLEALTRLNQIQPN